MKKKLIMGNWKMFGNQIWIEEWFHEFETLHPQASSSVEYVLFPPFPYLQQVGNFCRVKNLKLGAQNCAVETEGACTGEVSTLMLKDCGCDYVLIGHSERRVLYQETDSMLYQKFQIAIQQGLQPVFCVGETLQERQNNSTFSVLERQLNGLFQQDFSILKNLIIAYEPVWAIGTGVAATEADIQVVHDYLRSILSKAVRTNQTISILYGGSVKPDSAKAILNLSSVDGVLVGSASLRARDFVQIATSIR